MAQRHARAGRPSAWRQDSDLGAFPGRTRRPGGWNPGPAYAPADNVIGVAALAPASDRTGLVDNLAHVPGGSIFAAYVITAYSQAYQDVSFRHYVRPAAQVISRQAASRCLSGPGALVSIAQSLALDKPIYAGHRQPAPSASGSSRTPRQAGSTRPCSSPRAWPTRLSCPPSRPGTSASAAPPDRNSTTSPTPDKTMSG